MYYIWILVIGFAFSLFVSAGHAQGTTKHYLAKSNRRQYLHGFLFPNIEKLRYYENIDHLEQIAELEKQKKWARLQRVLLRYVRQFGIENFYRDTNLIWRLAKLTELLEGLPAARPLYRMVLRHHYDNIDVNEIEFYTKALNQNEIERYVPLTYYYKLVEHQRYIDTLRAPYSQLLNMGEAINTESADYAPFLSPSQDRLFYTSRRHETQRKLEHKPNEDIFFSHKRKGYWDISEPLRSVNTEAFNEGSVCVSAQGDKLYFSRCNAPDSRGGCDLYSADLLHDGEWGNIKNMGERINSAGWDSQPSLSPTGDTLYFASTRMEGFGLSDLYYSYKKSDGSWSQAQNLGPWINTRGNELSPFVHPVGGILYFSSNQQLYNFGNYDIYKSLWMSGHWSEATNIGPIVNGPGNEHYFTIDGSFERIYYAKSPNEDWDRQDLYSFPLPMEAHPDAITPFRGTLTDQETGDPMQGIVSIIDLEKGMEIAPKYLSPEGSFSFRLIDERQYLLIIQGDDFFRIERLFYLQGATEIEEKVVPISRRLALEGIQFEKSSAELNEEAKQSLRKVIIFMQDHPDFRLEISGHTDQQGADKFNLTLSYDRANNIKSYMVEKGEIKKDRIRAKGLGSHRPIVKEEKTEADRALNRRVEFLLYRGKKK